MKRVIPVTIILTGASVNLTEVARVGAPSLVVIVASNLCGCVAAVVAGAIEREPHGTRRDAGGMRHGDLQYERDHRGRADPPGADDDDLLLSVWAINSHGIAGDVFAARPPGAYVHASPLAFGVWAGVTVHASTAQAITTGFAYSARSGTLATLVRVRRE